jgi:hypothetical protein
MEGFFFFFFLHNYFGGNRAQKPFSSAPIFTTHFPNIHLCFLLPSASQSPKVENVEVIESSQPEFHIAGITQNERIEGHTWVTNRVRTSIGTRCTCFVQS